MYHENGQRPHPRNLQEAENAEFFGGRKEGSTELTREELHEWIARMTSEIYARDIAGAAEVAKFLIKTKQRVDLFHQVDAERAHYNVGETEDGRVITASPAQGHYYGQGVYWGINEPYLWVAEQNLGECYIVRDVPVADIFPVKCAGQIMAVMPVRKIECLTEPDVTSQATLATFSSDVLETSVPDQTRRVMLADWVPPSRLVYSSESGFTKPPLQEYLDDIGESDHVGKYIEITKVFENENDASWWKAEVYSFDQVWNTEPLPGQEIIAEVDKILGVELVEEVKSDPDRECPFYRIYVKEKKPLLCMAVAAAARLPELVFGNSPLIQEMKNKANEEGRVIE